MATRISACGSSRPVPVNETGKGALFAKATLAESHITKNETTHATLVKLLALRTRLASAALLPRFMSSIPEACVPIHARVEKKFDFNQRRE